MGHAKMSHSKWITHSACASCVIHFSCDISVCPMAYCVINIYCSAQNVDTQLHIKLSHILRTLTVTPMLMAVTSYRMRTHTITTKWGLLCNIVKFSSPSAKSEHFTHTYRPRTNTLSYIASCSVQNVDTKLNKNLCYILRTLTVTICSYL